MFDDIREYPYWELSRGSGESEYSLTIEDLLTGVLGFLEESWN